MNKDIIEKIEYRESTYKLDDFMQTIKNKKGRLRDVFDFYKLTQTPFQYTLSVSMRGLTGKTFNGKDFAIKEYLAKDKRTFWIRNLSKDVNVERKKFLTKDCPQIYKDKNCKFSGSVKSNSLSIVDEKGTAFIKFSAMNTIETEKGSREIPDYIFYDEFNVNANLVNDITTKFDDMLHSTEDIVNNYGEQDDTKIFMFGNGKSLNHPLLIQLGITHIKYEITEIWVNDTPLMLIIWVKPNKDFRMKFIEDNKRNPRFLMSALLGKAEHSYFNESLYDEVNYVSKYFEDVKRMVALGEIKSMDDVFTLMSSFYHKGQYYNLYKMNTDNYEFPLETKFHINLVEREQCYYSKPDNRYIIYSFDIQNKKEGVISYNINSGKKRLTRLLSENLISFENVVARDIFIQSIK